VPPAPLAFIGAGGVGGYFAAVLARAGVPVRLLARGEHLDAIRRQGGVEVHEPGAERFLAPVSASDDPATLAGSAFALVTVKSYSLAELAPTLRALAGDGTVLVPLLNGIDIAERVVAGGVSRSQILGGLTYIAAARTAPGVIARTSPFRRIIIGELDGSRSERAARLVDVLGRAPITAEASEQITLELWRKFAFLTPLAALCGLARGSIGPVRRAPSGQAVLERAVREIVAVARATGVPFSDDDTRHALGALEALPDSTQPSFLADLLRGGPTELDVLSGTVVRLARNYGIDVPVHETALAALSASS
jgi:2-dehydropantoate 2-reductase